MVPRIVQFGGHPYLAAWYAGVFDTLPDLVFVLISQSGIDVPVALLQCSFDCITDFIRLRLPCTKAYRGYLGSGVQCECFSIVTRNVSLIIAREEDKFNDANQFNASSTFICVAFNSLGVLDGCHDQRCTTEKEATLLRKREIT